MEGSLTKTVDQGKVPPVQVTEHLGRGRRHAQAGNISSNIRWEATSRAQHDLLPVVVLHG